MEREEGIEEGFELLPDEILEDIMVELNPKDIKRWCETNLRFRDICRDQRFRRRYWNELDLKIRRKYRGLPSKGLKVSFKLGNRRTIEFFLDKINNPDEFVKTPKGGDDVYLDGILGAIKYNKPFTFISSISSYNEKNNKDNEDNEDLLDYLLVLYFKRNFIATTPSISSSPQKVQEMLSKLMDFGIARVMAAEYNSKGGNSWDRRSICHKEQAMG